MAAWYTITKIETDEPREWSSAEGGKFHAFRVTMKNAEGRELGNVEINKKPGNTPRLGSENYGVVDTAAQYGPKFSYAKTADGGPAVRGGSSGGGSGSSGGGDDYYRPGYAPEDLAAIRRQHALDFAAKVATAQLGTGGDAPYQRQLAHWARFFEESVEQAAEEAGREPEPETAAQAEWGAMDEPSEPEPEPEIEF